MDLLDRTTGKVVPVPDDQLQSAFQSGQYSFIKGDNYAFQDPKAGTVLVDAKEAAARVAQGHQIVPNADIGMMEKERDYGARTSATGEAPMGFSKASRQDYGIRPIWLPKRL